MFNPFWTNFAAMRPRLRLIEGGDNGGAGGDGGTGGTGDAGANDNSSGTGGSGDNNSNGGTGDQSGAPDVAALQATIARLEREKADARVQKEGEIKAQAKKSELVSLAKVLGVDGVDDSLSIEQITEKITGKTLASGQDTSATDALRKNSIESALVREAWTQKVDADKGDYLQFKVSQSPEFAALDPAADDFKNKISSIVKSTIESDPVFRATSGGSTGNGGGDHGGSGGANEISKEAFDAMTVAQKTDLFNNHRETFNRLVNS